VNREPLVTLGSAMNDWQAEIITTKDPTRQSRNQKVKTDFTTKARRTRSLNLNPA
jgi:hypothetical protein